MNLLKKQQLIAEDYLDKTVFVDGPAGTGKTTAAIERVKNLIRSGVPADSILVLVPQATLALPYRDALRRSRVKTGGDIHTATLGSLAYQMVDLFWPLIADDIGFENPLERPHFLRLELVQYYMTRFIEPEIVRNDYFNSVHITRNRLYTQIIDNLNKSAIVRFPHTDISRRLSTALRGEVEQAFIYDDAQACANLFREMCRQYNLLDFSLQVDLFVNHLWTRKQPRRYLTRQYRHLIVDNIEEDTPATHDILIDWLQDCDSALLIYDTEAGYRRFLGADPIDALKLQGLCEMRVSLDNHRVMSPDIEAFQIEMARSLKAPLKQNAKASADARSAIHYPQDDNDNRYLTQMIGWTADNIAALIQNEGVSPNEIVVLSAYLPDALRFLLQSRLDERGVPHRSHRPSRALREEPATRALLTLAKLAHPQWNIAAERFDVTYALTASIADLDLVRAHLLTDLLYRNGQLIPFDRITDSQIQSRITFDLGTRYERLRQWITAHQHSDGLPLDTFFSRLFGEVLSQPKFGFHGNFDAANTAANLIESARSFRQTVSRIEPDLDIASEYIRMVDAGVIANQYVSDWDKNRQNAVLIAPAYTFLMANQSVDYQFWLNIGSTGWGQRLHQPLTHPNVMSRQWIDGDIWTGEDENKWNQLAITQLALGLIRRCRKRVYLGFSQFGEQGVEQRGPLLMAVQSMLRRLSRETQNV